MALYFDQWAGVSVAKHMHLRHFMFLGKTQIAKAKDPHKETKKLINEYKKKFANPYVAAERGYIDDVIKPHETRSRLITWLTMLETKVDSNPKKKHGNIPL